MKSVGLASPVAAATMKSSHSPGRATIDFTR